jgi:hypothetical protein
MKKYIFILIIFFGFFSCDEHMEELNKPTKSAIEVPGEMLFTNGVREMFDLIASSDVNSNVFRLYAQYWAQTTYPDESQFNMVGRKIPDNFWTFAYRDILRDLTQARKVIEETSVKLGLTDAEKNNQIAIIDACRAYMYAVLVDSFGAIPFTEAIDDNNLLPKYDAGADVYNGVIEMLDGAISNMTADAAGFSATQDPIYEGDMAGWMAFANSFKLRLAVNLADVDAAKASSMISEVLSNGNLILTNDLNASITYQESQPNTSPVWDDLVASGRADYVVANTLVDELNALNDPRVAVYAQPADDEGDYIGGIFGKQNTYAAFSAAGELFHEPTLEGVILDAAEVNFLLAEAAARGINAGGTAEDYYNEGITQSMLYWGIDQADIDAYLAQPEVVYNAADWKQQIGTQEWIALYNNGFEGWTTWRRLDFTGFNVPEGLTYQDIPVRLIFPIEEATLNPSALKAAIGMIGADNAQTRVFWDKQ